MALGRGLAMLGLGRTAVSAMFNDCRGETWVMFFGEVDVADEAEPCLLMLAPPTTLPHWPCPCWAEPQGMGMGEMVFVVCDSKRESFDTLCGMFKSGSNSATRLLNTPPPVPPPTLTSCCSVSSLIRSG